MTSSTIPSARRPSAGAFFDSRRSRGWPSPRAWSASRTTTGWAQLPPTQPTIVPSGWTIPLAPGRAEVGRATATTVATTNGRPAVSSSAALAKMLRITTGIGRGGRGPRLADALLVEDRPDLLGRDRDVDVAHAEMPQRVDDRVGDRRRGADGGRLPDALCPDRVMGRR